MLDLCRAKSVYLALKLYSTDHEGRFPDKSVEGGKLTNANEAFQNVVSPYIPHENSFYVRDSAWTPQPPDGDISPGHMLEAGENGFAYVPYLTDNSNPSFPLIAEGFKEGEPGVYASDQKVKGGRGKGKVVIIIRVDGSAKIEKPNPANGKVYNTTGASSFDIFAPAPGWLEPKNKPLNPASK